MLLLKIALFLNQFISPYIKIYLGEEETTKESSSPNSIFNIYEEHVIKGVL